MNEETLKRMAFCIAVIGIISLYVYSSIVEIPITTDLPDYKTRMRATVEKTTNFGSTIRIAATQQKPMVILAFNGNISLQPGTTILVTGTKEDEETFIADDITVT